MEGENRLAPRPYREFGWRQAIFRNGQVTVLLLPALQVKSSRFVELPHRQSGLGPLERIVSVRNCTIRSLAI